MGRPELKITNGTCMYRIGQCLQRPSEAQFFPCQDAIMLVLRMNLLPPSKSRGEGKEPHYSLSFLGIREILFLLLVQKSLQGDTVGYMTQASSHAVLKTDPCKAVGFVSHAGA